MLPCGHRFELIQRFTDPPAETCAACGQGPCTSCSLPGRPLQGHGLVLTTTRRRAAPRRSGPTPAPATPESPTEPRPNLSRPPRERRRPTTRSRAAGSRRRWETRSRSQKPEVRTRRKASDNRQWALPASGFLLLEFQRADVLPELPARSGLFSANTPSPSGTPAVAGVVADAPDLVPVDRTLLEERRMPLVSWISPVRSFEVSPSSSKMSA